MTLEKRLSGLGNNIRNELIDELKKDNINPRRYYDELPYLKYDLVDSINEFFEEKKCPISQDLYSRINKEPLKRVDYGIRSARNAPTELLKKLEDWEKIYFFAGIWEAGIDMLKGNSTTKLPSNYEKMDLCELAFHYIKAGILNLYKTHRRYVNDGKYESEIQLPFVKEIYAQMKEYFKKKESEKCKRRYDQTMDKGRIEETRPHEPHDKHEIIQPTLF